MKACLTCIYVREYVLFYSNTPEKVTLDKTNYEFKIICATHGCIHVHAERLLSVD